MAIESSNWPRCENEPTWTGLSCDLILHAIHKVLDILVSRKGDYVPIQQRGNHEPDLCLS